MHFGRKLVDSLLSVAVIAPAVLLKKYRSTGSAGFPATTRRLKSIGVFPITDHYYEPQFHFSNLRHPLATPRNLPGIDLNLAGQAALLQRLTRSKEVIDLDIASKGDDPRRFSVLNPNFGSGDAEFLYQFLRELKPRKLMEIGSGHSTKIAHAALTRNAAEGASAEHVCIEPFEMSWLEQLSGVTVIRSQLQETQFDWARELEPGDLLFIDSSHVIRPQGDVLMEYLEILPRLRSGVHVHVHDIFTPRDYPARWMVDEVRLWNEQYLLEAVLGNTARYEVVAALNMLKHANFDSLKAVCPYLTPDREPGSFYFKIR